MQQPPASDHDLHGCERTRVLTMLLDDEERGRRQPVEHYIAAFPSLADFVRAEYEALLRDTPPDGERGPVAAVVGRYRIRGELGAGGMGRVYEAVDPQLGRRVVLKSLHPTMAHDAKAVERLRREARVLGGLDHAHLVKVIDFIEADGAFYLVMPFLGGRTLAAHIVAARSRTAAGGAVPFLQFGEASDRGAALRSLLTFFVGVASGLSRAHQAGVVHRDIKPDNLMVLPDGSPVVIDFGLAMPGEDVRLTAAGELLGTPLYMAPEQIEGGAATAATDVHALGVVLYEALTLVHPFAGPGGRAGAFHRILVGDPLPLRRHDARLSRDLEAVVMRAIDRVPARRYATMEALARDLRRVLDLEPTEARPVSAITAGWRRLKRRPGLSMLVTAMVIVVSIAVVAWHEATQLQTKIAKAKAIAERGERSQESGVRELATAVLDELRSLSTALGMYALFPIGRVAMPDRLLWLGHTAVDEDNNPGHASRHRYRVTLLRMDGGETWSEEVDAPADPRESRWCAATPPPDVLAAAVAWKVVCIGWHDEVGQWNPTTADEREQVQNCLMTRFQVVEPASAATQAAIVAARGFSADLATMRSLLADRHAAEVLRFALLAVAPEIAPLAQWKLARDAANEVSPVLAEAILREIGTLEAKR